MRNKLITTACSLVVIFSVSPLAQSADATGGRRFWLAHRTELSNLSNQGTDEAGATEILEKHVAAIGGRAAFGSIRTVEIQSERAVLGRTIKVYVISDLTNKRTYRRQDGGNGVIELGFDGNQAWQKAPYFRGYLSPTSIQAKALSRVALGLNGTELYDYQEQGKKFSRLPNEKISGKEFLVIRTMQTDETGKEVQLKYFFDPATYLIRQIVSGDAITQRQVFEDYRRVEGRLVAFAETITNPQVTLDTKVLSVKLNVPVDPSIFEFHETSAKPEANSESTQPTNRNESRSVQPAGGAEASGALSEKLRLDTFELVWKTVYETYWDRTFNGVDWKSVHDKYLPQVKAAPNSDDYHRLLNQMVQELHLSHFGIVPPGNVLTLSSDSSNLKNGTVGLSLKWVDGKLVVSRVQKDFPAQIAGIRSGFIISGINGKTPDELYAAYKNKNPGYQFREELARVRSISEELNGKPGAKIDLEIVNDHDVSLRLTLTLKQHDPGRVLEFEAKKLPGNIGYIKFNFFFGDLLAKFKAAINELRDTDALIIDLRGNPGGAGDTAPAIANLLCSKPGSLGSLQFRYETQQYSYAGSNQAYKGRLILLVDEGSGSTSEVFIGGLQESGRATVIGSQTAGAVLPSLAEILPTGGALKYVISNFRTPKGKVLEGFGITPDVAVRPSRSGLLADRDEVLDRAIKFVRS
jgi:carboxyl-terminal processing protease